MNKLKLLILLLFVPSLCLAQEPATEKAQSVNFNLLGFQYNYELPLGRLSTVNFHAGTASDLVYESYDWGSHSYSDWGFTLRGIAGADFRYFYNLDRRSRKGKNTGFNSGNFLSLDVAYVSPALYSHNIHTSNVFLFVPNYGLRRVYPSGWLIEARVGYGIGVDDEGWGGKLKADFKFGYRF